MTPIKVLFLFIYIVASPAFSEEKKATLVIFPFDVDPANIAEYTNTIRERMKIIYGEARSVIAYQEMHGRLGKFNKLPLEDATVDQIVLLDYTVEDKASEVPTIRSNFKYAKEVQVTELNFRYHLGLGSESNQKLDTKNYELREATWAKRIGSKIILERNEIRREPVESIKGRVQQYRAIVFAFLTVSLSVIAIGASTVIASTIDGFIAAGVAAIGVVTVAAEALFSFLIFKGRYWNKISNEEERTTVDGAYVKSHVYTGRDQKTNKIQYIKRDAMQMMEEMERMPPCFVTGVSMMFNYAKGKP